MSELVETGSVHTREMAVDWQIPNFNISGNINFQCPVIVFKDIRLCLKMFPKGTKEYPKSVVVLYDIEYFHPPKCVKLTLGIKKAFCPLICFSRAFERDHRRHTRNCVINDSPCKVIKCSSGPIRFISHSALRRRMSALVPSGVLTITCSLTSDDPHFTEVTLGDRLWNLRNDLKTMLKENRGTDFTLKVGGSDFSVHRMILESRCGYFAGMFGNRFQENETGVAEIDDIEKDVFQCILTYLYTGEVEGISNESVYKIYVAADKLLLEELKKFCVGYMKRNLSRDSICDAVVIAEKYNELGLENFALDFFTQHADQIFESDEWNKFKVQNEGLVLKFFGKVFVKYKLIKDMNKRLTTKF